MAARTNATPARLSHVVQRLENRGLIERFPCPEDARATNARLTSGGWAKVRRTAPGHVETVRQAVMDALTERETLAAALLDVDGEPFEDGAPTWITDREPVELDSTIRFRHQAARHVAREAMELLRQRGDTYQLESAVRTTGDLRLAQSRPAEALDADPDLDRTTILQLVADLRDRSH